ncbi:Aldolase-type TIM barrel [Syntrophomonas zehnderi OL-4]|uniref:Aldolase-type TIM barrel n=1 Tax=Syntrophomonas zehnderi OL-4 TaxID=690567 RepID=A0A0E3W3W1_9FIRM|nr:3-deoxy-7-phosphoheptulonate synthase [Syntrophomonas zehnderi]CFY08798.1 Aldolase-type TIM barrel [Syntrophomonas zehnderi OL-4]
MVVVMQKGATQDQIQIVQNRLEAEGFNVHLSQGVNRTIMGVIGEPGKIDPQILVSLGGVEKVVPILQPFKLASRDFKHENSTVQVGNCVIGDDQITIVAGPCAVEGREIFLETAWAVKKAGADMLRGGAFKPRTSPYSFQGLGEKGLKIMAEARELTGLPIVTEVMDQKSIAMVAEYADVIQVGARNMQNFFLLRELGKVNKPILLKRGMSATIEEWLMAAEYILGSGNPQVILCERGIRTFETYTRNTLDLSAVPLLKHLSHLPVMVDPSHGTGKRDLVEPMSMAAVACGTDGIMVEVHPDPANAWSDGPQSLIPDDFSKLAQKVRHLKGIYQLDDQSAGRI